MTHRHNNEREFEAFLAGEESELARLYRRLPQSEPDAKLDAAVLALARAAVEPQRINALRHANQRHRRPWWLVGLSSAAGLVLAAGVAWQLREGMPRSPVDALRPTASSSQPERDVVPIAVLPESPVPPPPPPAPFEDAAVAAAPAAPPAPAADSAAAGGAARARATPPPRKEVAAVKGEAQKKDIKPAELPNPVTWEKPVMRFTQPPQNDNAVATFSNEPEQAVSRGFDSGFVDRQQPPESFVDRALRDNNSVERKAALATGSRRDEYGLAAGDDGRIANAEATRLAKRASAGAAAAPPAPAAVAPAVAAAPAAETAAAHATTTAATPAPQDKQKAEAQALAAAATTARPAAKPAPGLFGDTDSATATGNDELRRNAQTPPAGASDDELRRNAQLTPPQWIEEIRALLKQQRRQAALDNLARFKQKHPQFALPEDLRELR